MSAETILYTSCTPHRPRTRYHIVFEDFEEIGVDIYNAHALRAFEVATNQRIRQLREQHGIPETQLPHEDDLWIPMPYRALEALTLKAVTKSTCQRILAEESIEDMPPSLIELGFIRRRFAARRTNESRRRPLTTIYKDSDGEFILVDESGNFIDEGGLEQSAMMYGFGLVERQYLYVIETVNTAIAALDGLEPPQPMPRCDDPMMRRCAPPRRQKSSVATSSAARETTNSSGMPSSDANNRRLARRGTNHIFAISVNPHDSTDIEDVSRAFTQNPIKMEKPGKPPVKLLYRDTIDLASLRTAGWTPEAIIGLTSFVLDVPAKPDEDDEEALRAWLLDWYEPACWLIIATKDEDPRRAWVVIHRHIRGMISGPTWYARRTTPGPITLRNVVGPADPTRPLSGYNWRVVEAELDRAAWYPNEVIAYDGPPLVEYETGYESVEPPALVVEAEATVLPNGHVEAITEVSGQATESSEEPRELTTDEVIAVPPPVLRRRPGMSVGDVEALYGAILDAYPGLLIDYKPVAPGCWVIKVDLDESRCFDLDWQRWQRMTPKTQQLIGQAALYAAALEGGGSSPPPQVESEEINDQQGENRADHNSGALQAAMGPS
ncbi:hypothetical protein KSF_095510 [Reticulibacter mediterranei]|uniref:Uncharacterized protein n=1 Tax=Reticulibacter mediterranei TaxID=2778369 RepID=A0A8J3N8A9_9CHLR|nr:hypothetical protein [Reticulibacter mediterranei]GHO99503.1 hypothetical protein KSF_095510 [Reticulibacter mediterranei]